MCAYTYSVLTCIFSVAGLPNGQSLWDSRSSYSSSVCELLSLSFSFSLSLSHTHTHTRSPLVQFSSVLNFWTLIACMHRSKIHERVASVSVVLHCMSFFYPGLLRVPFLPRCPNQLALLSLSLSLSLIRTHTLTLYVIFPGRQQEKQKMEPPK